MRVADWIIATLEQRGIDHAFIVSGGACMLLCEALASSKMQYVSCHHEQAASMAAEAYARVRTGIGLTVVTSGPGGTNAITGVAGAWLDHVPTLTISGQSFSNQVIGDSGLRQLGVQELNIVDLVRPITKYAVMVTGPESIRFHLEKALYLATEGRPGPVWLDIPADVLKADIDPESLSGFEPDYEPQAGIPVAEVIRLLRSARRPVLHIGQGVRLSGGIDALYRFLEASRIPVLTARNGNDLIASDHPLYIGRPGTFAQRGANFAVQICDLYLAIGTRLSLAQTGYNPKDYARNAKVVMVDIDRAELDKDTVRVDLKIEADAKVFLDALSSIGTLPDWSEWLKRCKVWQAKYSPVFPEFRAQAGVNSYVFADTLSDVLTEDDVVVTDVGFSYQTTNQAFRVKLGQRFISNGGLASMGWGLPAAVGASFGSGKRVICISGDGGLMFNAQELSTIRHHNLPIKIFVLHNGGYLTQKQGHQQTFGRTVGAASESLSFPDFQILAEAHGIFSVRIDSHKDLERNVRAVVNADGPILCELVMDQDQIQAPKAVNRRLDDGTIKQTAIEDAWPYLDAHEIAENLQT